jgi:hypothetical protein
MTYMKNREALVGTGQRAEKIRAEADPLGRVFHLNKVYLPKLRCRPKTRRDREQLSGGWGHTDQSSTSEKVSLLFRHTSSGRMM